MRELRDGYYWVQACADLEPEVALYDDGCWRLIGMGVEPLETVDLFKVGRRIDVPAIALDVRDEVG